MPVPTLIESGLSVILYDNWEELQPLRKEWDALLARSPTNEIFLTFNYLETWSHTRTRLHRLHVLVIRRDEKAIAIAPLMICRRGVFPIGVKSLEFIGTPDSDYGDFLYSDIDALRLLLQEVDRHTTGVDFWLLDAVKDSSPTRALLAEMTNTSVLFLTKYLLSALPERPGAPPAAYVKRRSYVRHLRRHLKRLSEQGALTTDVYRDYEQIATAMETLFDQYTARWKMAGERSKFRRQAYRNLYLRLAEALSRTGNAFLSVLRLNGAPIACQWGFLYDAKCLCYTTSVDVAYWKYFPGMVAIFKLMEALVESEPGVRVLDFGSGDEHYKTYFSDRDISGYRLVRSRTLRGLFVRQIGCPALSAWRRWQRRRQASRLRRLRPAEGAE